MQARVIDLLAQISIDDITVDLLRYNDEFNNAFKTFEKYMQERNRRFAVPSSLRSTNSMPPLSNNRTVPLPRNADDEPALIRFDDDPTTSFQNMRIAPTASNVVPRNVQPQST
ncbi:unnamed protein product [Rotaria socialis]|nr:unnamed protein product [Rotaria socialis]